jgi:predicted DsbA family dithiol-disulfide isomerase
MAEEVSRSCAEAESMGVSGVPLYIIDGRVALYGAQPTARFVEALDRAATLRDEPRDRE